MDYPDGFAGSKKIAESKSRREQRDERIMRYSDHVSMLALWWKAIFLLPIWGWIVAAIFGAGMTRLGPVFTDIGYLTVIFSGLAYFISDVLKRKIKVADGMLFHGYASRPLSKLSTFSVNYETDKLIPKEIVLTFQDGYIWPFELTRLDAKDVHYLVKYVDKHYPHCNIDPTLRTLSRCQELSPQMRSALSPQIEIPYHAHRVMTETFNGFMNSLSSWARVGPLLVCCLCPLIWLNSTWFVYLLSNSAKTFDVSSLPQKASTAISGFFGAWSTFLTKGISSAAEIAANPLVGMIAAIVSLFLFINLLRRLHQPTLLILDQSGINFMQGYKLVRYKMASLNWFDIGSADMTRSSESSQPDQWKIVLKGKDGKVLKTLEYGAFDPRGRADFYERLKHFAPGCLITPTLAEALMSQQQTSYTELWLQSLSSSPEREKLEPLEPGNTLNEGRYEVLMKLGVGGQGAAYLSRVNSSLEKNLCEEVVLKETIFPIFVEESVRRQSLERFEHEARTLNLLSHDRIVKLRDYFVEDHRGYLVLEHIEGKNLRDHALGRPMDEKEVIELALQMCDMLEYLHERNVIHRDFTPDNLMLEVTGTVKLIDFNVAQTHDTGMTGTVVGKHAYVPPEQFRGKPIHASDIYAMGCTLYFMLSGKDPEPITQSKIRSKREEISTALDTIIQKCTTLKTEQRYQDASALRADLLSALEHEGTRLKIATEDERVAVAHGGTIKLEENLVKQESE